MAATRKQTWVIAGILLLLLPVGIWWLFFSGGGVDPEVARIREMQREAFSNMPKGGMPSAEQFKKFMAIKEESDKLTPEQRKLALECWKNNVCETGHGNLTVAYADGFGENVWRQVTKMEFIEQALTYPSIKKIIYTSAAGDATKAVSDMRAFIAQKVDIIVIFADAGPALLPPGPYPVPLVAAGRTSPTDVRAAATSRSPGVSARAPVSWSSGSRTSRTPKGPSRRLGSGRRSRTETSNAPTPFSAVLMRWTG